MNEFVFCPACGCPCRLDLILNDVRTAIANNCGFVRRCSEPQCRKLATWEGEGLRLLTPAEELMIRVSHSVVMAASDAGEIPAGTSLISFGDKR